MRSNRSIWGTRAAYIEAHSEVNPSTPLVEGVHCRDWTGAVNIKSADYLNGWGSWKDEGEPRERRAHRISYVAYIDEIPEGMHVLHRCDRGRCVEPLHLETGTHEENMRQMNERKRNRWYRSVSRQTQSIDTQ